MTPRLLYVVNDTPVLRASLVGARHRRARPRLRDARGGERRCRGGACSVAGTPVSPRAVHPWPIRLADRSPGTTRRQSPVFGRPTGSDPPHHHQARHLRGPDGALAGCAGGRQHGARPWLRIWAGRLASRLAAGGRQACVPKRTDPRPLAGDFRESGRPGGLSCVAPHHRGPGHRNQGRRRRISTGSDRKRARRPWVAPS